ncbi:hypothetical protein D9M68_1008880 [compost metagenome]
MHRQALEALQRRVAGAEVVDGQAYAQFPQASEQGLGGVRVLHHRAFGDFQLQVLGRQSGGGQDAGHFVVQL